MSPSSGGLVSALQGLNLDDDADMPAEMIWVGWPGTSVGAERQQQVRDKLSEIQCEPVFIDEGTCELYYDGFANNVLWPVFHYIPLPIKDLKEGDVQFGGYERANALFAKAVLELKPTVNDYIWVQDYHLMLVPALLRRSQPDLRIGFFLHIPFPSSEIYRTLPWRKELLQSILSSNLIGFHTHNYARHFQSSCQRILGASTENEVVSLNGVASKIGTFPIGTDPERFLRAIDTPSVQKYLSELKSRCVSSKLNFQYSSTVNCHFSQSKIFESLS